MKKITIVFALVCLLGSTSAYAQYQGDMYISGSIGMSGSSSKQITGNTTVKSPGGFQMSISPQFGYFVIDNLEIHLGLSYNFSKSVVNNTAFINTSTFALIPGVNYYLSIVDDRFYYTPGLNLGIGFGGVNGKEGAVKQKLGNVTTFSLSFSLLSFEYRPVDRFGISFRAGDMTYSFMQMKYTDNSRVNTNGFDLGLNLNASIGFRYYF